MGKAKITITGKPEKAPKINDDGTVDLLFKVSMSTGVPKGLKPLGDSFALVHVAPKTWKKVSNDVKEDSFFIVQGEAKASKNSKDTPFFEVVAFDIALNLKEVSVPVEKKEPAQEVKQEQPKAEAPKIEKPKQEQSKPELPKPEKQKQQPQQKEAPKDKPVNPPEEKSIQWYAPDEVIHIDLADICLVEHIHLNTRNIEMGRLLKAVTLSGGINTPMAVRKLENGKYGLVMGMRAYVVSKILNLEKVPVVIREMEHGKLVEKLGISTYENK